MQILKNLNRNYGASIIVVTPNPAAAEFADKIIHMSDGRIVK